MSDERKGLTGSLLRGLTRNTVEALAMKMGLKPNERGWVTLDIGASLISVSPKVAMDFFKSVQEVSQLLENDDLRAWAEMGRKVALSSVKHSTEVLTAAPQALKALRSFDSGGADATAPESIGDSGATESPMDAVLDLA